MLWAIMDEGRCSARLARAQIMRAQLAHLLRRRTETQGSRCSSSRPRPVLTCGVGGPFVIAEFRDAPEVAYLDTAAGGQIADHPDIVKACAHVFDTLRAEALPPRASLDLIAEVRDTWT